MNAFWIILTGVLVALPCSLLGVFLMLRRLSMVGDAISHAVLPGIVLAYLLSGTRNVFLLFLGAAALGLLTTMLIELLQKRARLQSDASIGVTFTWLFALGVIMISAYAGQVDLDQDCVLYGEIAYVPLDLWMPMEGWHLGPRPVWILGAVSLLVIGFIVWGFRRLQLTTFDPNFADAVGISSSTWHYLLMGLVSLTTVAAFEAVGAILVVALLVVPPATAFLLTDRLSRLLLLAGGISILSAISGYGLAVSLDGSIAAAMATTAGGWFFLIFLFAPRYGMLRIGRKLGKSPATPVYAQDTPTPYPPQS